MRTPVIEQPCMVAFFWSMATDDLQKKTILYVKHVEAHTGSRFVIVTNGARGKELFLANGIHAFSLEELVSVVTPDMASMVDETLVTEAVRFAPFLQTPWLPGEPVPENPAAWNRLGRRILAGYQQLFEAICPAVVFSWNGAALPQRALAQVARQKQLPLYFMERGLLPDTLVVDPVGVNYGSQVGGQSWALLEVQDPTERELSMLNCAYARLRSDARTVVPGGRKFSREQLARELGVPAGARVLLLPLQIEHDSNLFLYSPHFKKNAELIAALSLALTQHKDTLLLVKPHPEDHDNELSSEIASAGNTRLIQDVDLHSLLTLADVVVTINSTVGLEAAVLAKPVVTLGKAVYGEKGFTFDLQDGQLLEELLGSALEAAGSGAFNQDAFDRFMLYILKYQLFPVIESDLFGYRSRLIETIVAVLGGSDRLRAPLASAEFTRLLQHNARRCSASVATIDPDAFRMEDVVPVRAWDRCTMLLRKILRRCC